MENVNAYMLPLTQMHDLIYSGPQWCTAVANYWTGNAGCVWKCFMDMHIIP